MNLELHNTCQSMIYFEEKKAQLYATLDHFANGSSIEQLMVRGSGLGFGLGSGVLTIACRVARVAECIIKGFVNIFGSFGSNNSDYDRIKGIKQLSIQLPAAIMELVFSPVEVAIGTIITAGALLFAPKEYTEFRVNAHESSLENYKDLSKQNESEPQNNFEVIQFLYYR